MSECEWTSREACTADDAPVPCCGPCTQWMAHRIKELEGGIREHWDRWAKEASDAPERDLRLWSLLPEEEEDGDE